LGSPIGSSVSVGERGREGQRLREGELVGQRHG